METTEWIYDYLGIPSRAELKTNQIAQKLIKKIGAEYKEWLHV
jgi:hypothetical protein